MADRVGFEPTVPLLVHLISSQGRYDRFDTCPYCLPIIPNPRAKIKMEFWVKFTVCSYKLTYYLYKSIDNFNVRRYDMPVKTGRGSTRARERDDFRHEKNAVQPDAE